MSQFLDQRDFLQMNRAMFLYIWQVRERERDVRDNISAGHGGDGFLKFQDNEEISSAELADAFQQMWQKKRSVYLYYLFMSLDW